MKGYKAFGPGMVCRGKQYAENTTFAEDKAVPCKCGMHFCRNPFDVFDHYPLIDDDGNVTEFAEVEALDEPVTDDNRKWSSTKLHIGAKIGVKGLAEAFVEYVRSECDSAAGDGAQLAAGDDAQLAAGDGAQLAAGYDAQLAAGNDAQLAARGGAKLAAGNGAQLVAGDGSQLAAGGGAQLAAGDGAQLVVGDGAQLVVGYRSQLAAGKNTVAIVGNNSIFRAGLHSAIVNCRYGDDGNITSPTVAYIDGKTYKPDTWYSCKDGEIAEVQNEQ